MVTALNGDSPGAASLGGHLLRVTETDCVVLKLIVLRFLQWTVQERWTRRCLSTCRRHTYCVKAQGNGSVHSLEIYTF